jgi:hypothetical protein
MCFSRSRIASETFGLPSAKRSPFHSGVKALMYSGEEPTFWLYEKQQPEIKIARNNIFLFIVNRFMVIVNIYFYFQMKMLIIFKLN